MKLFDATKESAGDRQGLIITGEELALRPCPKCGHSYAEHDIVPNGENRYRSICEKDGCGCRWLEIVDGVMQIPAVQ